MDIRDLENAMRLLKDNCEINNKGNCKKCKIYNDCQKYFWLAPSKWFEGDNNE